MSSLLFSERPLADLKKVLRAEFPHVRSSHITESLAAALGFRTHAALLAALPSTQVDPPFIALNDDRFDERLQQFGYPPDAMFSFEQLDDCDGLFSTHDAYRMEYDYRTTREKAWRNLMVATINEGIRQQLYSLRPYDNRWPGAGDSSMGHSGTGCLFDFTLPCGCPVKGYVSDAGFGELNVHAAVHPNGNALRALNAGFDAGEAVAAAWLERKDGLWLQYSPERFNCRRALLDALACLNVQPAGYGDRGSVR